MNISFRRKRTNENSTSIRFEHVTSPYFFQRTDNRFKRNLSNGETRALATIHSKPLINRARLWDDDDDDEKGIHQWKEPSSTLNIRKKG